MGIAFIVACICSLIYFAGGFATSHPFIAGAIGGGASAALGILFAHIQRGMWTGYVFDRPVTSDQIEAIDNWNNYPIYVAAGQPGIGPACAVYKGLLDGQQALIIERAEAS